MGQAHCLWRRFHYPDDSVPPSLANSTIEQYYLHSVLTGLQPGQTYYYSVGHDG